MFSKMSNTEYSGILLCFSSGSGAVVRSKAMDEKTPRFLFRFQSPRIIFFLPTPLSWQLQLARSCCLISVPAWKHCMFQSDTFLRTTCAPLSRLREPLLTQPNTGHHNIPDLISHYTIRCGTKLFYYRCVILH